MIRAVLFLGLTMTVGSGAVAYDYTVQSSKDPAQVLELSHYMQNLQVRVVDLMEKEVGPRIAALPQIAKGMTPALIGDDVPDTRTQIDDFASSSPQLQAMIKADRAAAKESWWARIRQKVSGGDAKRTDRLAGIRERNFPKKREGLDPNSLSGMSAAEIYQNRAAISEGLSNGAANNMNATVSSMQDAGIDMSGYKNYTFD